MPVLSPAAVRKQIASGQADPVYVLLGDDDIEKAALAQEFEDLVEPDLRPFNVERIHAGDQGSGEKFASTVASVIAAARTLPMMAPRRVVIVMRAEGLLLPKRESEAATKALEEFEEFLKKPEPLSSLVLVPASLDKRSRLYKLLLKQAVFVECGSIEDLADAERWVKTRVTAAGMPIEPAGARLLAERCGTDLKRLRNDVDRLLLYAMGQKTIALDDVREIVGATSLQDEWAMTNAIEAGDGAGALRQLALVLDSGAAPEKILGQLGWVVRAKFPGLKPAGLRQSIDAVFRTDLDLKRSAGDPRVLLERLVVELCGGKRRAM